MGTNNTYSVKTLPINAISVKMPGNLTNGNDYASNIAYCAIKLCFIGNG